MSAAAKDVKRDAIVARNKIINEYFVAALEGHIAADTGSRLPEILTRKAMDYAIAAYNTRCAVLGENFDKEELE